MKRTVEKINLTEKGITLIALVITIIILLILAGVTLNTALSENGLFKMAKKAVNEYQEAERKEQDAIEEITKEMEKISIDYNDYVGAYVTGYTPKTVTSTHPCTIGTNTSGHTGAQDFTTDQDMKWRIWDYDRTTKTIRLISSKPTTANLTLANATGYNNGVYAVNEICRECYGSDKKGITVANLRRTDIQKVSTYDYKNYKHDANNWQESDNGTVYFGATKKYETNFKYPKLWNDLDSNWTYGYDGTTETGSDKECEIWEREYGSEIETGVGEGSKETTFKQSYYCHDFKSDKKEFINETYYDLLFNDPDSNKPLEKTYWLAGRYVHLYESYCDFGLQLVNAYSSYCRVNGYALYLSNR